MSNLFIGVDVGTGSARAGVFDAQGTLLATAKHDIEIHRDDAGRVEQSSAQVWDAVTTSVREAVAASGADPAQVKGIGVDATCSLVVMGPMGGLPVGDDAAPERDIIVWMDHRATGQAARINEGDHDVLKYVGGRISPEMETPKLLWLKENRPEVYAAAAQFFDLTDFLTWKATGALDRSSCTLTCKWTYLAHEERFDPDYFHAIGLGDLADEDFARIGASVVHPGTALGQGLTAEAAEAMGLVPGTAVAAGLIDAHAGGVGTVAASGGAGDATDCLGYVFGTSSCTMTTTREPAFVPGVWGPYYSAMVPGMWLNEGGQSAAGAAIAHLVTLHPATAEAERLASAEGKGLVQYLADRALELGGDAAGALRLADDLHVIPEFLGNRAPFADPEARAVIAGQGMEQGVDSLVALYVAGVCGLGYGLRQIIETQDAAGAPSRTISVSGGAGAHPLTRAMLADATGREIEITECAEPVLLGSAMLGAVASGGYADLQAAMPAMSRVATRCTPAGGATQARHAARYDAFLAFQRLSRETRGIMAGLTD
ncbi:MAG: ribulokinase [Rhodobacteraceae bacterium]|jgi:D-ribulokinase|uniref:D-ribulokinase n=1 Tax=Salipiger profundus TaxID=1229727 RepID=A0A1U7DCL4_9RHOB|nr:MULTISPECIES: FGGY-family carbohydrate kinase [Salipiger]APX25816.1 D-ribulokinase [Salipiger profundus]MAB08459.1 ribulokinase [Paracoccaceae bacterium]SFC86309.1 D-ribulokinase [Salipiger profundus]